MSQIVLKQGKAKSVRARHPWIFSGAVEKSQGEDGSIVAVCDHDGEQLGSAFLNRRSKILGRMLTFGTDDSEGAVEDLVDRAIAMRDGTVCRLINAEGDGLSGLIVDRYDDVLVMQIGSLGMEHYKSRIVDQLVAHFNPRMIYERSTGSSRKEEGLQPSEGILYGEGDDEVIVEEDGIKLIARVKTGQKTGLFLDHREMRRLTRSLVKGRDVLNLFSYTGAFAMAASAGGAEKVTSVDVSASALEIGKRQADMNGFENTSWVKADAFQYVHEENLEHQFVVVDPPAFAKKRGAVVQACRGYKDLNRIVLQKVPAGAFVLTCSCSYHVDPKLFQQVVFQAASEAGREVTIVSKHRMALDHPVSIYHPEGEYLKSLLLYVSR